MVLGPNGLTHINEKRFCDRELQVFCSAVQGTQTRNVKPLAKMIHEIRWSQRLDEARGPRDIQQTERRFVEG